MLDRFGRKNTIAAMFLLCGTAIIALRAGVVPVVLAVCVMRASALAFNQVSLLDCNNDYFHGIDLLLSYRVYGSTLPKCSQLRIAFLVLALPHLLHD